MDETQGSEVVVCVPAGEDFWGVERGSAVVAFARALTSSAYNDGEGDDVDVWFEGNVFGAANLRTFADLVRHAAGRATTSYPTSARRRVRRRELHVVGAWDPLSETVAVSDAPRLAAWLGRDVEARDLSCSD